ncbi:MAG TPA: murein biosynthesis integral membrane protein MurJ [Acidimicrobiia bacterium]|jgi:putative peptidoglycan lipid II flippase|nr:murein biosynthesis integral membrane protein MurJ [Acidimicrobiia bacterium]
MSDDHPSPDRDALARSSAAVATGTLLSRVTGLVRVVALAWALGGGSLADAYNLANTTPNIVYELILGGILAATIVPIFVRQIKEQDHRSISAIFTVTLTVVSVLTLIAMIFTPLLARLFAIGSSGAEHAAQVHVVTILLLCFLPQMVFYALTALSTALLNAHRRFVAAAFAPVCNNIVVIATLLVFAARTSHDRASWTDATRIRDEVGLLLLLGLGTTAGIVLMALVLLPAMRRAGARVTPVFAWRDTGVRTMTRLAGWTFGYVAANQVAQLFVLVLAKSGDPGNVTAYVYAFTFYVLPHGLLAVSIMTTLMPELARRVADDDAPGLRRDFSLGLRYLVVLMLPASVLFVVLAQPIVGVLNIGKFAFHNSTVTGDVLQLFAISLLPFSLFLYEMRLFYAHADTRRPFLINLVENSFNVLLAIALFPALGVQGLALAWSISYFLAAIGGLVLVQRRIGAVVAEASGALARASLGCVALALVAAPLAAAIGHDTARRALVAATAGTLAGGVAYLLVLLVLRSEELRAILRLIRVRGRTLDNVSP